MSQANNGVNNGVGESYFLDSILASKLRTTVVYMVVLTS